MVILIISVAVSCFGIHDEEANTHIKPARDTIYYASFLDLVEKLGVNGGGSFCSYDLTEEKEVMNVVIRKLLKNHFTLIQVPDSCYEGRKIDSISRRSPEFMKEVCKRCSINKNVISLDAVWQYQDKYTFSSWRLRYGGIAAPSIIGTWWDIHASIYSPIERKMIFHLKKQFTQWQRVRPVKWWPGISHKRFFERPIKEVRKFLLNNSNASQ